MHNTRTMRTSIIQGSSDRDILLYLERVMYIYINIIIPVFSYEILNLNTRIQALRFLMSQILTVPQPKNISIHVNMCYIVSNALDIVYFKNTIFLV